MIRDRKPRHRPHLLAPSRLAPSRGSIRVGTLPALGILLLTLLLIGCDGAPSTPEAETPTPEQPLREVTLFEEALELEDGGSVPYERGVIQVPMQRQGGSSGMLEVEFYRFRRNPEVASEAPPIFLLHGGPGFGGLGPRLARPGYFEGRLAHYTQIADLVVPGQRGFGTSTGTPCQDHRSLSVEEALSEETRSEAFGAAAELCKQHWQSEGVDLGGLNVLEAAADVVDISRALGYDQIQLWGVSFGSHWAMTTLRDHPERVARATLGGLEGPDHTYDMPSWVLAAFERIAASAEASPDLAPKIPEGGLLNAYGAAIERADQQPLQVEAPHPETGEVVAFELDGDALRDLLASSTAYTAFRFRMQPWPMALLAVAAGELDEGAADYLENVLDPEIGDAAFYQIDCASGLSRARGERLRNDPAAALLGRTWRYYDTACAPWEADLGEDFRQPFQSEVPVILVQGNWDTSTPYENAVELRPYFANHRFVHVEGGSHGALREAIEEVDGFREAVFQWLATGNYDSIPERVDLPAMNWAPSEE